MKILKIYIADTNKQKQPLLTKNGEPYNRVAIQTAETQGKWASNNIFNKMSACLHWKIGQDVNVELEQDGEYLNWKFSEGGDKTTTQIIIEKLENIEKTLKRVFPEDEEINETDILKIAKKI